MGKTLQADRLADVAAAEARPVEEREEPGQRALRRPHPWRQDMRSPIRPAHSTARAARGEMGPLDVSEVFVVKSFGEGLLLVFEGVDGPMLAVEIGAARRQVLQRLAHEVADLQSRSHGVARVVDRSLRIKMRAREIEHGVAEDCVRDLRMGVEDRSEEGHRLGVAAPEQAHLQAADMFGQLRHDGGEVRRVAVHVGGVHLVPQVPGEDGAPPAPSRHHEGEPVLGGLDHRGGGEPVRRSRAGPAIRAVVGMMPPVEVHPERVEGREQEPQPVPVAEVEQVVPKLDHRGHHAANWLFQIAMADLRILHHHAKTGDAAFGEPGEVAVHGAQVLAAEKALKLGPGDGVVLANGMPAPAVFGDEIGRAGGHLDPGLPGPGPGREGLLQLHVVGNDPFLPLRRPATWLDGGRVQDRRAGAFVRGP